jgi:hypothetical protein
MRIDNGGREHAIYADCLDSTKPVEVFSIEKQKSSLITAQTGNLVENTKYILEETKAWLPFFAEAYNISANVKDYVLVPVVIMPSDLPNRNKHAFPYTELVRPNVEAGCLGFETWNRKSVFTNHVNSDYTKSKGIILSSIMRPIKNSEGNLWKVICLLAIDRKNHPILANNILTGKQKHYSMGAWSSYFTCSVCGAKHTSKEAGCNHVSLSKPSPTYNIVNGRLAYLMANNILGFEVSAVDTPAYVSATSEKFIEV